MSLFYVDPGELARLAQLLERLSEHALAGRRYVQSHTGLAGGEGWINQLSGAHETVVGHTLDWLAELGNPVAIMSASTINRAAAHYENTDRAEAARLDASARSHASLLDVPDPAGDHFLDAFAWRGRFDDVLDPQDHYRPPPDYHTHDDYLYQPQWHDRLSFAGLGREAVYRATEFLAGCGMLDRPYDPYEFALKPVVGDWAGFRGCADVFRNVALALAVASGNVHRSQVTLPEVWRGRAADSCNVHLGRIRRVLLEAGPALNAVADRYQEAADGQAAFRRVVAQVIDELVDAAILLMIAVAAGAVTVKTVIGPVIAGLVGIGASTSVVACVRRIEKSYQLVDAAMAGVEGALHAFGQLRAPDYRLPTLPEITGGHSTLDHLPAAR
jgi:hypothetical protein